MASDLMKKRELSRTGVFGSTTRRFYRPVAADPALVPGPGDYNVPDRLATSEGRKPSSMFASKQPVRSRDNLALFSYCDQCS